MYSSFSNTYRTHESWYHFLPLGHCVTEAFYDSDRPLLYPQSWHILKVQVTECLRGRINYRLSFVFVLSLSLASQLLFCPMCPLLWRNRELRLRHFLFYISPEMWRWVTDSLYIESPSGNILQWKGVIFLDWIKMHISSTLSPAL